MIMGGDKKKMASVIIEKFGAPKKENNEKAFEVMAAEPESEMDEGLLSGAEEVISAMAGKDAKRLAMALKDFFYMCDEMPHEEGEHIEEEEKSNPILG